ncbi:MAG: oxidoreductase [Bdellovibrionales bacterium GWB1_55_8]|nr:MAG: oxidoreductase [Bdellovibrionales bacterium GWB1_55_8]
MNNPQRRIRYGVIGLGHIAQAAVLPAFEHAENAELAALFSRDREKLKVLGNQYGVQTRASYDDFETVLRRERIDAVYIALPNHLHREYTIRAAKAGCHVLCEKPMALNEQECWDMIHAANDARIKLMIAYRLHFEEANLSCVELIESGVIGDPRFFDSVFAFPAKEGNIRTRKKTGGGPLYDIGIYCINAVRYLFRSEPVEVVAIGSAKRVGEVEETVSAIMRFPEERIASFTCSFGTAHVAKYSVSGTKGEILLENAYQYTGDMIQKVIVNEETSQTKFAQRDQFAPELIYFSNCILNDVEPEPSGYEGLADIRVIEAIQKAERTARAVVVEPLSRAIRPDLDQAIDREAVEEPKPVHAESPKKEAA